MGSPLCRYEALPETVRAIDRLNISGNIVPHSFYHHLTYTTRHKKKDVPIKRPYLEAILILSDILYWHRPTVVRDPRTNRITGYRKKFDADIMRRSYKEISDWLGISRKQAKEAMDYLEESGYIERKFPTLYYRGGRPLTNVMHIIPLVHNIEKVMTFDDDLPVESDSPPEGEDPQYLPTSPNGEHGKSQPPQMGNMDCPNGEVPDPSHLGGTYSEIPSLEYNKEHTEEFASHEKGERKAKADSSIQSYEANSTGQPPDSYPYYSPQRTTKPNATHEELEKQAHSAYILAVKTGSAALAQQVVLIFQLSVEHSLEVQHVMPVLGAFVRSWDYEKAVHMIKGSAAYPGDHPITASVVKKVLSVLKQWEKGRVEYEQQRST